MGCIPVLLAKSIWHSFLSSTTPIFIYLSFRTLFGCNRCCSPLWYGCQRQASAATLAYTFLFLGELFPLGCLAGKAGGQPGTREACAESPWQWGLCSGLDKNCIFSTWLKALMGRVLSPNPFQIRLRKLLGFPVFIDPGGYGQPQIICVSAHAQLLIHPATNNTHTQLLQPIPRPASADTHFRPAVPTAHSLCCCSWNRALLQAAGTQLPCPAAVK